MPTDFETIMTDYQATDGIMIARSMRTMLGSQPMMAITLTTVEFNVPIADSVFVMPK